MGKSKNKCIDEAMNDRRGNHVTNTAECAVTMVVYVVRDIGVMVRGVAKM